MADTKVLLRKLLKEIEEEDRDELLESLKGKKLTGPELLEAIRSLPPESRREVREALAEVKEKEQEEEKEEEEEEKEEEKEEERESKSRFRSRTRPGRKSGRAYGWWIDEEGEVVKLDIARIYSGEDEPDEVELPPKRVAEKEEEKEEERESA